MSENIDFVQRIVTWLEEAPKTDYSDKLRLEMREYCLFQFKLTTIKTNLKKRFRRNLHLIFPGYDMVFKDVFTKTSRGILTRSPTPDDMLEAGTEKLRELMQDLSKNHIDPDKANELMEKAKDTIPSEIIKESALFELQMLLDLIETLEKQIAEVDSKILSIWDSVKDRYYTQTIDGLNDLKASTICAETYNKG